MRHRGFFPDRKGLKILAKHNIKEETEPGVYLIDLKKGDDVVIRADTE